MDAHYVSLDVGGDVSCNVSNNSADVKVNYIQQRWRIHLIVSWDVAGNVPK